MRGTSTRFGNSSMAVSGSFSRHSLHDVVRRISSPEQGRPRRFSLDQRPGPVPCEPPCTTVNCN